MTRNRHNKNAQKKKEQMSNMIKIRNVGAQKEKKWRPGGPPLEGRGAEGWSPEEWGPEGSGAQRSGAQT